MQSVYVVSEQCDDYPPMVCAVFKTEEEAEAYIEWRENDETVTFYIDSAPLL